MEPAEDTWGICRQCPDRRVRLSPLSYHRWEAPRCPDCGCYLTVPASLHPEAQELECRLRRRAMALFADSVYLREQTEPPPPPPNR